MPPDANPRAALVAEMARPDDEVQLERAALLIAAEEYPGLDVGAYLGRIDALADGVRARLSGDEGPTGVLAAINGHLFRDLGYHGNRDDYYDPRNSYLNDVLDRRTGIPIALAVLYAAVARRLGHRLVGVNLPLHFMLAWPLPAEPILIDVFDGGAIVTPRDCADRLASIAGRPVELRPEHLEVVGPRPIARRMLNNLFAIYVSREDYRRALAALERMNLILPALDDLRDRGLLHYRLREYDLAQHALDTYLQLAPGAADRGAVEQHLDWIRRQRAERE